jgi:repressor LexA
MNRPELTKNQAEVLSFVKKYMKAKGYPPTRQEITTGFGWASVNAAQQHLHLIEKKGYIRVDAGIQRGIVIL